MGCGLSDMKQKHFLSKTVHPSIARIMTGCWNAFSCLNFPFLPPTPCTLINNPLLSVFPTPKSEFIDNSKGSNHHSHTGSGGDHHIFKLKVNEMGAAESQSVVLQEAKETPQEQRNKIFSRE